MRLRPLLLAAAATILLAAPASASAFGGRQYVKMADGTELAVYIHAPQGYDGHTPMPVLFEYDGYDGGSEASYYGGFLGVSNDYIMVHAGVRGAGCSAGAFSLFSEQQAEDGASL